MDGELAHRTVSRYFPGADKARSDSVRHSPECEAFGTWVLNSCFMEVKNEFQKHQSQEDRGLHNRRHPGIGNDRAAACSDVLTEGTQFPEGR